MKHNLVKSRALLALAAVLATNQIAGAAGGTTTWSGAGANQNWSTSGNWSTVGGSTPPASTDTVVFGGATFPAFTNSSTAVNCILDVNQTVASLSFANTNNQYENIQLSPNTTLTVSGFVNIGTNLNGITKDTTTVTMSGTGNLIVNASATDFWVGGLNALATTANLTLPNGTNTINAAVLSIGESGNNNGATSTLSAGGGTNIINANTINLGSGKASGTLNFSGSGGGITIRNTAGTGRATLKLGNGTSASGASNGQLLLAGHPANVMAGTVTIAAGTDTGAQVGLVTFDTGTFDVTSLLLGNATGTGVGGSSTGTLTVGGSTTPNAATLIVNSASGGSFVLGDGFPNGTTPERPATGIFNLNTNATAQVYCSITKAPPTNNQTNTGTLNITGGTLVMEAAADTVGTLPIPLDNFNLTNATLTFAVSTSVTNVAVTNLNLGGAANTINITALPTITTYPSQFPLFKVTTLNGTYNLVTGSMPGTYSGYISNNTATMDLVITNGPALAKNDTWNGNVSGSWDKTTLNWLSGGSALYVDGDLVTFDDTLTGTANINLATTLSPGSLTVANTSSNYVFSGAGKISGTTSLVKNSTGTLTLTESGADNFSGGIAVNGGTVVIDNNSGGITGGLTIGASGTVSAGNNDVNGTLPVGAVTDNGALIFNQSANVTVANAISGSGILVQSDTNTLTLAGVNSGFTGSVVIANGTVLVNNTNALGSWTSGTVTVTNGATLDIGGIPTTSLVDFGAKQFYVGGAGVSGNGVIVNSGANNQDDAFQKITLMADATFGGATRWDLRNGSPSTLNQNGFTLIKTGSAETSLVSASILGGGNIVINQGILSFEVAPNFTGSGTITVNSAGTLGQYKINPGTFTRPIVLNGGTIQNLASSAGVGTNDSPTITLTANSFFVGAGLAANSITLNGAITESGGAFGLTKSGTSSYISTGTNTYTGNTVIASGPLALSGFGSLQSANITVASGATFDVSTLTSGFILGGGQTLGGSGVVTGAVTTASGALLSPGSNSVGTLTFNNALTLNASSTNNFTVTSVGGASNKVVVVGLLTPNNSVINITSGTALSVGTNTLFTYGSVSGSFAATPVFDVPPVHATSAAIVDNGAGQIILVVPNHAPVAGPVFTLPVTMGTAVTVGIIGGKYTPSDADGDTLVITSVAGAANGTVTTDGVNMTYTATNGISDSFTYTVSDGYGGTATGTVNVTISSTVQGQNQLGMQVIGSNVVLNYLGIPNYKYALDWTTNLTQPITWTPLMTNTAAENGSLFFTNAVSGGSNFYRTRHVL